MVASEAVPKGMISEKFPFPSFKHISLDSTLFVIKMSISPSLSISFNVIFLELE